MPPFIEPQLGTLVDDVPTAAGWVYEIKFDGYRTLSAANGNVVRCYSRRGLNWTNRFGAVPGAIAALSLSGALIDGEMVVIDQEGRTSFSGLHDALKRNGAGLAFVAFGLLCDAGKDLRPLVERKVRLARLLGKPPPSLISSAHLDTGGDKLLTSLCRRKFEGTIAKRADQPYRFVRRNVGWASCYA